MNLNQRQVAILQEILHSSGMSISNIAKIHKKTRKTIYDDIAIIDIWLKKNNSGNITKNQFGNYIVENSKVDIDDFVKHEKEKIQSYNIDERRAYILFKILAIPHINIDEIASSLKVSKTSIATDINELKRLLLLQEINLAYHNKQYVLSGEEYNVRGFLINIIAPFAHKFLNENFVNKPISVNVTLINYDVANLCFFIQQQRVSQGFIINSSIANKDDLYIDDYLNFAKTYYNNNFEQEYFALLLKGFSHNSTKINKNKLCELIIEQLILSFSTILSYSYDKNISQILYNHFESSIYRLSLGIVLANPIFEDIVNDYKQAYTLAKLTISQFIKNEEFVKQESSYLAVLLLSQAITNRDEKIAIISDMGSSVAYFIKQQLIKLSATPDSIICINKDQLSEYNNIYLIVSTFDFPFEINYVVINPMLSVTDKINVYKNIKKQGELYIDINTVLNIVKTYVSEKNYNVIISQINAIYKQGDIMLKELITNETIQIQESCENWIKAVQQVAKPLLEGGFITEDYINATIANIKKNGPYVVLREGFALPHAAAGSFVCKIGMSLLILRNPVSFSDNDENNVYVIIMLAATDAESHINALSEMVNIISDDDTFNSLKNSVTKADVLNIINN